jgi:uroporphyrinogen decarboxylase
LNSRERVFRALSFEEPDRVPTDLWMSKGFKNKLLSTLNTSEEEFLDAHDVDLRYIEGPRYMGPPLREFADGSSEDIWGVRRKAVTVRMANGTEVYEEVADSPLASASTVEEIDNYGGWPSPDWFDYSGIEEQCEAVRRQERVVVFQGDRMNRVAQLKPAMYIRGMEQILMDMTLEPEIAEAVFANIRRFYCAYAERIFDAARGKIDIILTGDDFGSQNGPLVSPKMWVRFLGKGFEDYVSLAKSHGARVMHHTCGSVRPIIPLMLERGLDVLQSIQPEASEMDPRELKREFGSRLAFHGGISIQRTLPFGSPEDVRKEVRDKVEALGKGGGYILCTSHNIQADTPLENLDALLAAYDDYGRYS